MRRSAGPLLLLAAIVLLGPAVLAFQKGGYFDGPRLRAGVVAWTVVALVAVLVRDPLPRSLPGRLVLGGLAALTALTGLSLLWAPLGSPASDDLSRLLLYLAVAIAAVPLLRDPRARAAVEPVLLATITAAALYGLAERLAPTVVELERIATAGDRLAQPLTYWNATGAFAAMGLALAAGIVARSRRATAATAAVAAAPLGLALHLTYSRGALGAAAAGLATLVAVAPDRAHVRAAALVALAAAVPAIATAALPDVRAPDGSAAQGAAMAAVLAATAAAAAWTTARGWGRGVAVDPPPPATTGVADAADHRPATANLDHPPPPATTGASDPLDHPSPRPATTASARPARLRTAAIVAAMAAAAVTLGAAAFSPEERGAAVAREGPGRLATAQSNRDEYWRVALDAWADRPLLGRGTGGFQVEWLRERPIRESARDAHSLYVETAAELGLAGLAALLVFAAGVVLAGRRAGAAAAGATAAVVVFTVHAGVDWDWEMPAVSLAALLLVARLVAATEPPAAARPPRRPRARERPRATR